MKYAVAYVAVAVVFAVLDAVWLGWMGPRVYRPAIAPLLMDGFRLAPAIVFYVLFVLGLVIFGVTPGFRSGQWTSALTMGALFGFFCYATYDLTNMATLKVWPLKLTLIDIAWGTVLSGTAATAAYLVAKRFS